MLLRYIGFAFIYISSNNVLTQINWHWVIKIKRTESRIPSKCVSNHRLLRHRHSFVPHLCSRGRHLLMSYLKRYRTFAVPSSCICHLLALTMENSLHTWQSRCKWVTFMTAKHTVHNTLKNNPKHRHHLESNKQNEATTLYL